MDLMLRQRFNNLSTRLIPAKWVKSKLRSPIASITFDDFPRSAWTVGGPLLARYEAKATYYAAGRFCGVTEDELEYYTADDLRAVEAAGHEIGCHTFDHRYGSGVGSQRLLAEAERNQSVLGDVLGDTRLCSFAYPYGDASPRTKRLYSRLFPTSRGIRAGVNAGVVDLAQLRSVAIEAKRWDPTRIEAYVAEAVERTGWLTLFTHDVSDDPTPYGCTPAMLEHALRTLSDAGVEMMTVKAGLARVTFDGDA